MPEFDIRQYFEDGFRRFTFLDIAVQRTMDQLECPRGPAVKKLLEEFVSGAITTWKVEDGKRHKIAAERWVNADMDMEKMLSTADEGLLMSGLYGRQYVAWRLILIAQDELDFSLNLRTPNGNASTDNTATPSSVKHTVKASNREVRQWMRDRVANWDDDKPAPSEMEDWQAARFTFGPALTRADFRLVRLSETPIEWRLRGPRRPWGQVR